MNSDGEVTYHRVLFEVLITTDAAISRDRLRTGWQRLEPVTCAPGRRSVLPKGVVPVPQHRGTSASGT